MLCFAANIDYTSVMEEVVFEQGLSQQCVEIPILNDDILESIEQFTAILSTNDTNVALQNNSATVLIESADGMDTVT